MARTTGVAFAALIAAWASAVSVGAAAASPLPAGERRSSAGIFSFRVDNDLAAGTDRRYTNGIRMAWTWPELGRPEAPVKLPRWLDAASRALTFGRGSDGGGRFISISLEQRMYTPEDVTLTDVKAGEHPYAGYLGMGLAFQSRGAETMNTVAFCLGLVGPHSLAGDTQTLYHKLLGFKPVRGWSHQLKDEPVLGVSLDHKRKVWSAGARPGLRTDAAVRAGASLSNALTAGWTGAGIRAGWNLPDDFGPQATPVGMGGEDLPESRPRNRPAVFGYLYLEGQAVLHDIFLDGNLGADKPCVRKNPFRAQAEAGLEARWRRLRLSFGYVARSRWYETEPRGHIYAAFRAALVF